MAIELVTATVEEKSQVRSALLGAAYNAGNITGSKTFNFNDGDLQKASLTGTTEIEAPSNGEEGKELVLWLTPTGANRDLTFDVLVLKPSDSGITFPKTLIQNKLYIIKLIHNGASWMLVSLVGGF